MDLTKVFESVRTASRSLSLLSDAKINEVLTALAKEVEAQSNYILAENQKDLNQKDPNDPMYDRLKLTAERLKGIADGIREVTKLPSPCNRIIDERTRPNGLKIRKVTVPFGVIGIIYEARPNVTVDAAGLCIKSGNASILRGGSEAIRSNRALAALVQEGLEAAGLPAEAVQVV